MTKVISARNLTKRYGGKLALDGISFDIEEGQILGLIGPNGAGKTSFLRAALGLAEYDGELSVLGKSPAKERVALLEDVAFIADTAILPRWMSVLQLLQHMQQSHPNFSREKAEAFLAKTDIAITDKVKALSKGMITQLHLALVIAIEARLLVLDEPTLGLDILYRKQFYEQLLNDYYDESRTIIITTHQVEEIEHVLTDVMFIKQGQINLHMSLDAMYQQFQEIEVSNDQLAAAQALGPLSERSVLGGKVMLFEQADAAQLAALGTLRAASIADVFVAKMQ